MVAVVGNSRRAGLQHRLPARSGVQVRVCPANQTANAGAKQLDAPGSSLVGQPVRVRLSPPRPYVGASLGARIRDTESL